MLLDVLTMSIEMVIDYFSLQSNITLNDFKY